jgi:hypothetical protein
MSIFDENVAVLNKIASIPIGNDIAVNKSFIINSLYIA